MKIASLRFLGAASFLLLLLSCGGPEKKQPQARQEPAAPKAGASTAEAAARAPSLERYRAVITYFSGDVAVAAQGAEPRAAEVGDSLGEADTLQVKEESYCELQFADLAVMRVNANTTVAMRTIRRSPDRNRVSVSISAGVVLCKVRALKSGERFAVKTHTAICGVRGTEFSVQVARDESTTLAVKSGAVAVLPGRLDAEEILAQAEVEGQTPEASAQVAAAIEALENAAPVVKPDQAVTIPPAALAKSESSYQAIIAEVGKIAAAGAQGPDQALLKSFKEATEKAAQESVKIIAPPRRSTAENRKALEVLDTVKFVPLPETPAPQAEAKPQGGAPEAAAQAGAARVSIEATPADAEIVLEGKVVGHGKFGGLYPAGQHLSFIVRRGGYADKAVDLELAEGKSYAEKVGLETVRIVEPAGKSEAPAARPGKEKAKGEVVVTTVPPEAQILANGSPVGKGKYTAVLEVGRKLLVTARMEGYEASSLDITVVRGSRSYPIELKRLMGEVSLQVEPPDADILLGGRRVGTGTYADRFPVKEKLAFTVQRDGYDEVSLNITVESGSHSYPVELGRATEEVSLRVEPRDADILLDGQPAGTGSFSRRFPVDESLSFTFRRDGYYDRELTLFVSRGSGRLREIVLEPKPIQRMIPVSRSRLVGSLAVIGDTVFAADGAGELFAVSRNGDISWTVKTGNAPNENCAPVLANGALCFAGASELVVVDPNDGAVMSRTPLDGSSSAVFGRRPVEFGGKLLLPADSELRIIDASSGQLTATVPIPDGCQMTPAIWDGRLLVANLKGTLLMLDAAGAVQARVPTRAVQPVASAVTVCGDIAYFVGRKGNVACVDLAGERLAWERSLVERGSTSVFVDVVTDGDGVYAFAKGTLYGLSCRDGTQLFKPVNGVSAPPLLAEGFLYYGTGAGLFIEADAATGRALRKLELGARIATRPALGTGVIYAGTDKGAVIVINPRGMK